MSDQITRLALTEIIPGQNDRTRFDQASLMELADSIKEHGLAQPITVRLLDQMGVYQIVCGERRYRAMKLLGNETIACIIRELSDEEAAAIMLCENVARADLDPVDEGHAYQTRIERFNWTIQECAEKVGVSTHRVTNRLALLKLRPDLQDLIRSGDLQIGYANIIAAANLDANRQLIALARLRDNPAPTPTWFRREVSALLEEQAQDCLFDADLFTVQDVTVPETDWTPPPTPGTHKAPQNGDLTSTIVDQIIYWRAAADAWDALGKTHKRNECLAAIAALEAVFTLAEALALTLTAPSAPPTPSAPPVPPTPLVPPKREIWEIMYEAQERQYEAFKPRKELRSE